MKDAQAPAHIPQQLAVVITYLPDMKGYFASRLEVIKACLHSLRLNCGNTLPVLVWDNGSCPALLDWLRLEYKPDYLIQSPNIGKTSALACILRMFPPNTVIAYSDDDMLFYPGWLDAQYKVLEHFQAGMVSGYPVRVAQRWGTKSAIAWGKANGVIHTGGFIPDEWERDYAVSVGINPQEHINRLTKEQDTLIEHQDFYVYPMAQHCQFLCYTGKIAPFTSWHRSAMAPERDFDEAIDDAGLLRLTTNFRYTRHMGNVIDDQVREDIKGMGL